MPSLCIGFDGFIDHLYHAVQQRDGQHTYTPYKTLQEFSQVIQQASGKSCNIESIVLETTLGGNAPLTTLGLKELNIPIHLIGCLGQPAIHPLFASLENDDIHCSSIGTPGSTFAYEFQDGKLLLGTMNDVLKLSMEDVLDRCPEFINIIKNSNFLVTLNWTMSPLVNEFWQWLLYQRQDLLIDKTIFIDFSDPKKRPKEDIIKALHTIKSLSEKATCCISFNKAESQAILHALDLHEKESLSENIQLLTQALPVSKLYIHSSQEIVGVSNFFEYEHLTVPFTSNPYRLTGAGDMFNAGVLAALYNNKNLKEQLLSGMATSGIWIRTGTPPTQQQIEQFKELYTRSTSSIDELFAHN